MSPRIGVVALLAVSVFIAVGCGGDDSTVSPAPSAEGAEQRVREFMTAELEGDVDTACGYISDDLATELTQQVASCEVLVESQKVLADAAEARFEDKSITVDEVEGI